MKIQLMIICLSCVSLHNFAHSATIHSHSHRTPQIYELTQKDKADLAYLRHYARPKRSGSGDILNHLKTSLTQGIKSKLSHIGKGSASASSHYSSSSADYAHGYGHGHGYYIPDDGHHKPDVWTFKKSILFTVLQALKAIKGGVIAVKGQLIKGGGQLLQAKGKIIRGGGEVLTNLGKSIATSAFMIMPHHEEEYVPVPDYHDYAHHPPSYGHSGPGPDIHPHHYPSGGGAEYPPSGYASNQNSVYEGKATRPEHDGIVIIKKIPTGHAHHEHEAQPTQTQEFRPLSPNTPSHHEPSLLETIFSASRHKDTLTSSNSPHIAGTSYGTPSGNPFRYTEYIKKPQTYVTPLPQHEHEQVYQNEHEHVQQYEHEHVHQNEHYNQPILITNAHNKPQVLIGMKMPLNNVQFNLGQVLRDNEINYRVYPTPNVPDTPTQFLIEYPDSTDVLSNNAYHILSPGDMTPHKKTQKVKKPDFEVLRSIAFELKP